MAEDTLVENWIDDGRKLIEELVQRGFEVTAGCWVYPSEARRWRFYIISPLVDTVGFREAAGRLHAVEWAMPPTYSIETLTTRLIGPSDPIARDLFRLQGRPTRTIAGFVRLPSMIVDHQSIDDAYYYAIPAVASR